MSEVIVRMEMPLSCAVCRCHSDGWCYLLSIQPSECAYYSRPSWCPIVCELPEHGDLIDRDELKKHKRHSEEFCENIVSVAQIDWMPTIVPATERSETRPTNTNSAEREPANGYGVMAARMLE